MPDALGLRWLGVKCCLCWWSSVLAVLGILCTDLHGTPTLEVRLEQLASQSDAEILDNTLHDARAFLLSSGTTGPSFGLTR
jgi:hypothetical protein